MSGSELSKPHPIVLACGIARFDAIRERFAEWLRLLNIELPDSGHSFKGIKSHLTENGFEVHHTLVSFAADLETRATELGDQITGILDANAATKVHIIAHSMGGLDARTLIVREPDWAERIASLTTIGTPHWGTPVADRLLEKGLGEWIESLETVIDISGSRDLGTEARREFNAAHEAAEADNQVIYQAVWSKTKEVFRPLRKAAELMPDCDNDGLVPSSSQRWTEELISSTKSKRIVQIELYSAD